MSLPHLDPLPLCLILLSSAVIPADAQTQAAAPAQEAAALHAEIDQLKEEYAGRIAALELRLAAFEARSGVTPGAPVSATTTAKAVAPPLTVVMPAQNPLEPQPDRQQHEKQVAREQQLGVEPRYDELRDAEVRLNGLQQQLRAFEFHGYFRSGAGLDGKGGQQTTFHAPGADAAYRLGNENRAYGELAFVNNWINPEHTSGNAWFKSEFLIEADTSEASNFASDDHFRLREAWVQAGNLFDSQPNAKFWAGERYYRRYNIDINDFYTVDMSGYGGGVEDLNVKIGRAAIAYFIGAQSDIITSAGTYSKSNIDLRLYDVKVPGGRIGAWYNFAVAPGGTESNGFVIPSTHGFDIGMHYLKTEWHGGYLRSSIQYGTGPASNFRADALVPTPFLKNASTLLITDHFLVQPNQKFAILPLFLYQRQKDGNPADGANHWISFGARPVYFYAPHLSLAFESGFDHTTSGNNVYSGWLRKYTIAQQIGAGRLFFDRPVLRVFYTYADWSNGFRGLVGGPSYFNATQGMTYGVQMETNW
jgi:maltoporin